VKSPLPHGQTILDAIRQRRSIRVFTDEPVRLDLLHTIVEAGVWAPSGLNNQPWRFVLVTDPRTAGRVAELTTYGHIVRAARALIAVYLDQEAMYDDTKDHQAAGACIQNMLLAAEALGLGAVWLGQILKNKHKVNEIFGLGDRHDLMAVIAIGHPASRDQKSSRKPIAELILQTIEEENK